MSQNNKLIFVTHNKGKVESANKYFEGHLEFQTYDYDFREIRSFLYNLNIGNSKKGG